MTDAEIVERAADRAHDGPGHRLVWVFVGLSLIGVAALTVAVVLLAVRAEDNAVVARQLAEQVRELGAEPVVDPPVDGTPGVDGRDGVDGTDGADGAAGRDGRDGRDGVDGSDGAAGRAGQDGADGVDGESPPCLSEPAQCRGADGTDGADGRDGVDGSPPASWTWTDIDGREQSCTRTGGPDSAPTYTCTAEPPPETVPGIPLPIGG